MSSPEKVVFDSFMHSQGDPYLQSLILKWIDIHEGFPYEDSVDIVLSIAPRLHHYATSGQHKTAPSNQTAAGTASELIGGPEVTDLNELGTFMIHQDRAAIGRGPRPIRKIYGERNNPSHVALFGILGHTTGLTEYDHMYNEVFAEYRPMEIDHENPMLASSFLLLLEIHRQFNPQDTQALKQIVGFDPSTWIEIK